MSKLEAWVDGSCLGNDRSKGTPGGWAVILEYTDNLDNITTKEYYGNESETTNNRMELTAVIKCLEALKFATAITIYTDSKYIVDNKLEYWSEMGWRKTDGKPVANQDLWERVLELKQIHQVTFEWTKGHDIDMKNARCDKLAKEAARNANKS